MNDQEHELLSYLSFDLIVYDHRLLSMIGSWLPGWDNRRWLSFMAQLAWPIHSVYSDIIRVAPDADPIPPPLPVRPRTRFPSLPTRGRSPARSWHGYGPGADAGPPYEEVTRILEAMES